MLSSKKDSDLSMYHSDEDLLKWNQDGPGPTDNRHDDCFPRSAILCKGVDEIDEILLDRPDWIVKQWPNVIIEHKNGDGFGYDLHVTNAVKTGDIAACAILLSEMGKERFFLGWTTASRTTPLYHAAECGDIALVSWILNNGGDISLETANNEGKTPLFAACNGGHLDVVKILILRGATAKNNGNSAHVIISSFDLLRLNRVEELRLWIKKLVDDDHDVCDSTTVKRLKHVHSMLLERYLFEHDLQYLNKGILLDEEVDLSSLDHGDHEFLKHDVHNMLLERYLFEHDLHYLNKGILLDEVVDLSSLDHDDHEFLKHDPRFVDWYWDSPSGIKVFAIYEARKMARAALFEQIDPTMYMLCYYGTKKSDADEEKQVMDAEAPLVAIQTDNSGSINPSLSHTQADEKARDDAKKRRKDDDGRAVSKKKRKVVSTLQTKTPRSKSSVAPRVSLSPGTSPTECDEEQG